MWTACPAETAHFCRVHSGSHRVCIGLGEKEKARAFFERLLALRNDLGLLAEEYDPAAKRQLGNFPQAFSHIAIITTAYRLSEKK